MKIIRILTENGFIKTGGAKEFSSIVTGGVSHSYERDGIRVNVGLHEKGYPPGLISPRPQKWYSRFFIDTDGTRKKKVYNDIARDADVIEWVQETGDEEILEFLINPSDYHVLPE